MNRSPDQVKSQLWWRDIQDGRKSQSQTSSASAYIFNLLPSVMRRGRPTCSRGWRVPGTAWADGDHTARLRIREQRAVVLLLLQLALNFRRLES